MDPASCLNSFAKLFPFADMCDMIMLASKTKQFAKLEFDEGV